MNTIWLLASIVFVALSVMDWKITMENLKRGAVENNPLLGKHPSPKKLTVFAVVTTTLWLVAALWLASKGAPGIAAVFALGIFLRLWTVSKGRKLMAELKGRKP